jgi:hypothetical protein
MDFEPIILPTSGGMGGQFQRQYWNQHWTRVAKEDASLSEAMKIGPWVRVARKSLRKALKFWQLARFKFTVAAIANCNARMISRSQHITD